MAKEKKESPEMTKAKQMTDPQAPLQLHEEVAKAILATKLTREQREEQTKKFTAILDKQRANGEVPGKPTMNNDEKVKNRDNMINILAAQRVAMAEKGKID